MSLEEMKDRLGIVNFKIDKLHGITDETDRVAQSFHLGMVGGSGKTVHKLNRIRERSLDKTIANAKIACELYKERDTLQAQIRDIESGAKERREQKKRDSLPLLAEYFRNLKAGDFIDIGNGKTLITKKNAKSIETGSGCKWTAQEIIGKDAATLLNATI